MIDENNAIEVNNISKSFKVFYDRGMTITDRLLTRGRSRHEIREVLKEITFNVKKGEAVGIVGKNGCGKSTTLKLLTRIIKPDNGSINLSGRVSSLLELGAGFHPDMSGRENIYMNAAIFGLSKKEISKRLDEIIKFSELGEYIDNAVRTYSSGMYMRLAFSVAISVDADILLIDEILAVGDVNFQKKCFEKLEEIKAGGTTIVIVSHSLQQIEEICDRTIWIDNGIIKSMGIPQDVHERYLDEMERQRLKKLQLDDNEGCNDLGNYNTEGQKKYNEITKFSNNLIENNQAEHDGNGQAEFTSFFLCDNKRKEKTTFQTGDAVYAYITYNASSDGINAIPSLLIFRDDGLYCYGTNLYIEQRKVLLLKDKGYIKVKIKHLLLQPGKYYFDIGFIGEDSQYFEKIYHAAEIQIYSNAEDQGVVKLSTEWDADE